MEKIPVCRHCGKPLKFNGFASMGSSHSNWYICDNDDCPVEHQNILIRDEDLICDRELRV
jgi:hypothetical protein